MFNNIVFDVFIGLVLIYLLYSLFITIVGEMVATWFNLRARILRLSIEKMLNDGFHKKISDKNFVTRWWDVIRRFFLTEFNDFKYSFAGKFYDSPSIKYLSDNGGEHKTFFTQTKPSYISAEMFAVTLIQLLKDKGVGATDIEKIKFCLQFNTHHIEPSSLKSLREHVETAGNDISILKERFKAWFNETQDRATGWYKKKTQFILFWLGLIVAIIFNVDSIQITKILSKDKDARNQLVMMGIAQSKDSTKYKDFISHGDTVHAQAIIDSGYARVTRDIDQAGMVLGLGWKTADLRKSESVLFTIKANDSRSNMVKAQMKDFNSTLHLKDSILDSISKRDSLIEIVRNSLTILIIDTTAAHYRIDAGDSTAKDLLLKLKKELAVKTDSLLRFKAENISDSFGLKNLNAKTDQIIKNINSLPCCNFTSIDSIVHADTITTKISGKRKFSTPEKISYVAGQLEHPVQLFGLIITALLLSLGAPFWFDLLKKLVALRGAGVKPEEKKSTAGNNENAFNKLPIAPGTNASANTQSKNVAPVNATTALNNLTLKLKNEKGIIALGIQYRDPNATAFLNVFVENAEIKKYAEIKYGKVEKVNETFSIPVEYTVSGVIKVHGATSGSRISNAIGSLGAGTLGCSMKKKGSDGTYFISCWHVMKDNIQWTVPPENKNIINRSDNNKNLGIIESSGGFLSYDPHIGIDIGIAKYNNDKDEEINPNFLIKMQHRALSPFDTLISTKVNLFGNVNQLQRATIFQDTTNAFVDYPDGNSYLMNDVFSITIVDPVTKKMKAPTVGGDSGAVVIDEDGAPLGMVIGGNGLFTYAMKFSNVFGDNKIFNDFFFKI